MNSIGELIASLRAQKGWSMGKLAQRSELTTGAISQIERGLTKKPSAETVGRLAKALGVSPDYLYEQAGWYTANENKKPLSPEVQKLRDVIDGYPPGPARDQARQMIIDIAVVLETLMERMDGEGVDPALETEDTRADL